MADGRDEIRQKDRTSNKYAAKKAASERIAAQRAAQQRSERRRNVLIASSATVAVLVVVAIIVVVGVSSKKSSTGSGNAVVAAPSSVTDAISSAATSTLTSSTTPDFSTIAGPPTSISSTALKGSNGKAEVLYVGAEYCPYCAATRWPLTVALSRFGTFSNLKTTYSADNDNAGPHTPTLSFYQSSYTSQYIDFVSKEQEDGAQQPLEKLTSEQNSLFSSLGGGGYPFIDFGGKWMQKGTSYDPKLLAGMTPDSVAKAITGTTKQGKTIQASADVFTAIICEIDGGQPSNVCTAAGVKAADSAINGSSK
ncbi:MAG: DUF929 family protein [Acidothermaceae bacterium]